MTEQRSRRRFAAGLVALTLVATALLPVAVLATHAGNHPGLKGNVLNKAPAVTKSDLTANDDDGAAGVQVQPTSGTTHSVEVTVDVADPNGHRDVSSTKVSVYEPDNTTVHVTEAAATKSSGTQKTATYTYSFDMDYWHAPGTYHVKVLATDWLGATDTAWTTFEYQELSALSASPSTATFDDGDNDGNLDPGATTHSTPVNMSLENTGNVEVDLSFSGTDLSSSGSDTIGVSNIHLDADQDNDFATNEWQLSGTSQTVTGFNLARSTDGTAASNYILWAVHVPNIAPGEYTGSMTLEVVKST